MTPHFPQKLKIFSLSKKVLNDLSLAHCYSFNSRHSTWLILYHPRLSIVPLTRHAISHVSDLSVLVLLPGMTSVLTSSSFFKFCTILMHYFFPGDFQSPHEKINCSSSYISIVLIINMILIEALNTSFCNFIQSAQLDHELLKVKCYLCLQQQFRV